MTLGPVSQGSINVEVTDSQSYQSITAGFGAAFTDSSAYLLSELKLYNPSAYYSLLNDLFSPNGIDLTFWRVPMGASDATAASSFWTDEDTPGGPFALTSYDTGRIIPVIKDALAINPNLKIVGTPWSAPAWMKSNNELTCSNDAGLLSSDYQAWADYFVDWIKAYQASGVPIWAVTPQNEPQFCPGNYPGMFWDGSTEASWVQNYLSKDLSTNGLSQQILGWDHNWDDVQFPESLLNADPSDFPGIAWHCYTNSGTTGGDPTTMTELHNAYPTEHQYETECNSSALPGNVLPLGSTSQQMALLSLQNWAEGVLLWNVALDSTGGPTKNPCSVSVAAGVAVNNAYPCLSPIVAIDITRDTNGNVVSENVTKKGNFYQLGQISKFVQVGAKHIASTVDAQGIVTAAFQNPDGQEVLVASNTNQATANQASTAFEVTWNGQGSFAYSLVPGATATFVGNPPGAPIMPAQPQPGETFRVVSRVSGKPMTVSGGSIMNGAAIVDSTDDGSGDQTWTLQDAGGGYYNIVDANSGMGLDDTNYSGSNGTQMEQWAVVGSGGYNQQWMISSLGNGYFTITNRYSGLDLDLTSGNIADGTPIQQWSYSAGDINQEWQLIGTPEPTQASMPTAGTVYRVANSGTGKPIDVTAASTSDGAAAVQWADNDETDQQWRLVSAGSYYNLINVNSGKALEDPNGSTASGTVIEQATISGTGDSSQQWQLTPVGTGYLITNRASGLALDLATDSLSDGIYVQQSSLSPDSQTQTWQFKTAREPLPSVSSPVQA